MELKSVRALKAELLSAGIGQQVVTQAALPEGALRRHSALPEQPPPAPLTLGITGREGDYRLAVRVVAAYPGLQLEIERIADLAKGEVSVRIVGRVAKQQPWTQVLQRPLILGCSVGHADVTAGTLGAIVRRPDDDRYRVLSNNHVLANEDLGKAGDEILQPGKFDHGISPADVCAHLESAIPLKTTGNLVDAAVARVVEGIGVDPTTLTGLGKLAGVRTEPLGDEEKVYKVGRTTQLTEGRVSAFEVDNLAVEFDRGVITFDDQIEISPAPGAGPFSLGGDSGSLIVDEELRAVGLLFAGNDLDVTYASPISIVLARLGVELVS